MYPVQGACFISACAFAFIACFVSCAGASSPAPAALSIPAATEWFGNDGNWSPVTIRVGSPPQWVEVIPSTVSQETWVVGSAGCNETVVCPHNRGGVFVSSNSDSWKEIGAYELGLDPQLGFSGIGDYGLDNIAVNETVSVPSQMIGVVKDTAYWLGYLGLGIRPTNFTSSNDLTFLSSLVENQSIVPSHSYGYTAGAYYRLKNVPASLTLGGYDANRFVSHDHTFTLDPDQIPVVSVIEISISASPGSSNPTTGWSSDSLALQSVSSSALYKVDSSTPYLWFPEDVCLQFEKALGLIYDDELQLYTFGKDPSKYQSLRDLNLNFTFTIADLPNSSNFVNITLPYAAFDLQLNPTYPASNSSQSSSINYFPLRKATNSSQYTIGRVFLQESYLIVDYERNNFSLSQAVFHIDAIENTSLVDISRPQNSTYMGPIVSHTYLNKSAIAGIIIGGVSGLTLIIIFIMLCAIRRQRTRKQESKSWRTCNVFRSWRFFSIKSSEDDVHEVHGSTHLPSEAPPGREITELPGKCPFPLELNDNGWENSDYDTFSLYSKAIHGLGHDPRIPVELPPNAKLRDSLDFGCIGNSDPCTPKSPAPPYSISGILPFRMDENLASEMRKSETRQTMFTSMSRASSLGSPPNISPLTPRFSPWTPRFHSIDTLPPLPPKSVERVKRYTLGVEKLKSKTSSDDLRHRFHEEITQTLPGWRSHSPRQLDHTYLINIQDSGDERDEVEDEDEVGEFDENRKLAGSDDEVILAPNPLRISKQEPRPFSWENSF